MNIAPTVVQELLQPEVCAELRIIARDARLDGVDRDVLIKAADELALAYRQIVMDNIAMCEMVARLGAQGERLVEMTPKVV